MQPPAGEAELQARGDEALLGAVVQVALDPAARGVGGGDDPGARGAQLLDARELDGLAAQRRPRRARRSVTSKITPSIHRARRGADELAAVDHRSAPSPSARTIRYSSTNGSPSSVAREASARMRSWSSGWMTLISVRASLSTKSAAG